MQLRNIPRVATPIKLVSSVIIIFLSTFFLYASFSYANSDETTYYLLTDNLGSIDVVTDEDGNVVERRDFLPYGSERINKTTPDSPETDQKFTGKELDAETGLYYYGARYYDPLIGRFTSVDPWAGDLSNPQTLNKFTYVNNNPLRFIDPTGMYIMKTGEVEKGDTLGGITKELNQFYGTKYSYKNIARINNISDPNKISVGQKVRIGTLSGWQPPEEGSDIGYAEKLNWNATQWNIANTNRNFYNSSDHPERFDKRVPNEWSNPKSSPVHSLGVYDTNIEVRGKGVRLGEQAIFTPSGQLISSPENTGTYDFSPPNSFFGAIKHYFVDIQPWIDNGTGPYDTTTRGQRNDAFRATLFNAINPFD